jgi:hypothetical protein
MEHESHSAKGRVRERFLQFLDGFGSCSKVATIEPELHKLLLPMGVWNGEPPIIVWEVHGHPALLRLYLLLSVESTADPSAALDATLVSVSAQIRRVLPKGYLLRWYYWEPDWKRVGAAFRLRLEAYGVTTAVGSQSERE